MASLKPIQHNARTSQLGAAVISAALSFCTPWTASAEDGADCSSDDCAETASSDRVEPKKLSRKERRRLRKEQKAQREQAQNDHLDWYPMGQLSPAQLSATPPYCDGAYIEPDLITSGKAYARPSQFVIEGSSETESERADQDTAAMRSERGTQLEANSLSFDKDSDTIAATGNIEIREKGVLIRGSSATHHTQDGTGSIENAEMVSHQGHTRVRADKIERESEYIVRIYNGEYTRCAPSDNAWLMRAGEFKLNQETNIGTARNAQLRIKDVPIFWTPWISYPMSNERRSGLLFPNLSTSTNAGGLDFSIPWYWNIAPNWDATIAPRYVGTRGLALEGELRYLNRYSDWQISGSIIDDDTIDESEGASDTSGSSEITNPRWYFGVLERGFLPKGWSHRIKYTQVSDDEYLNDLSGATSLEFQRSTNLEQSARMLHLGRNLEFSADVVRYQIIDDSVSNQYTRLPQLWLAFESENRISRPTWLMEAQATHFDINDTGRATGNRVYLEPGVNLPLATSWGRLTTTLKLRSVTYALDSDCLRTTPGQGAQSDPCPEPNDKVLDENPSTTLPMLSLDGTLFFDRPTSWFGKSYTHTLEPRLYYLYSEYENQSDQPLFDTGFTTFDYNQLFRESRFTGFDRIADANQLSIGLTTRLRQNASGVDTVWASLGQTIYFADRRVTLDQRFQEVDTESRSPIAGELGYQWNRNLRTFASLIYDRNLKEPLLDCSDEVDNEDSEIEECKIIEDEFTERSGLQQAGLQLRYFGDNGLVFNLGHRYRVNYTEVTANGVTVVQDYINQTDASTIFPITRHWALLARYNYDFTNNRTLGMVAGFEYNSCCWKTRLVFQEGLSTSGSAEDRVDPDVDSGLYFQFVMKGLGGADTGVRSILEDSIVHYEDYDKRDAF